MATNHTNPSTEWNRELGRVPDYDFLDCASLAKRWKVPESWVRDQVRSRAADPIPHVRFGRYVRFEWQHPDLIEWLKRRRTHYQRQNGRE